MDEAYRNGDDRANNLVLVLPNNLREDLIRVCLAALPRKAYGLIGGRGLYHPESLYPCASNLRTSPDWSSVFESFGDFYKDPDRGFVVSVAEQKELLETIRSRSESFIGVYHSHRCTRAVPSEVDLALHVAPGVLCYIVSVEEPDRPELRIYRMDRMSYEEVPFRLSG